MPRLHSALSWLAVITLCVAAPAIALNSGSDVLVPAAGRTGPYVTDLYVMNPGTSAVTVTLSWLVRDQSNPNPVTTNFTLQPGETEVLGDVILNTFGLTTGAGAFHVEASGDVIVNSRIYAVDGDKTFGQGFEGVPTWAATSAGQSTDVVGLTQGSGYRSNVYALAGADGASMALSLRDPSGAQIASTTLTLGAYEPYLKRVTQTFAGLPNFPNATLHVTVNSGLVVVGASKADNLTDDPTTLESKASGGAGSVDGTYQVALYDSASFASGGNFVVEGGQVSAINATYVNYDKLEGGNAACPVIFLWGIGLDPTPVADFGSSGGVTFVDDYTASGSGVMTWTVKFTVDNNMGLTGTVTAVGSEFPSADAGCNGTFPALTLFGGKSN
jgi:hypothetical protein